MGRPVEPAEPAALTRLLEWLRDTYPALPPMRSTPGSTSAATTAGR